MGKVMATVRKLGCAVRGTADFDVELDADEVEATLQEEGEFRLKGSFIGTYSEHLGVGPKYQHLSVNGECLAIKDVAMVGLGVLEFTLVRDEHQGGSAFIP